MGVTLLQSLRESKNWTQEYVAEVLDITQSAYARIESGKTKLTIDRAKELAKLYGIAPEAFFSNASSVVNYNSGEGSFGGPIYGYSNYGNENIKYLYERMLEEKDSQITHLKNELSQVRQEKDVLVNLLEKISVK